MLNNDGPVGKMRQKLYKKKNDIGDLKRIRLKPRKYEVKSSWVDDNGFKEKTEESGKPKKEKKMTFYFKFFIFSFCIFFNFSVGSFFYI